MFEKGNGEIGERLTINLTRGRSIFEGWAVATKVLDGVKRSEERLVFKIDFKKAYNCVAWVFLLYYLRRASVRDGSGG